MDQIVRQSTEIGVNDITPVISRYSLSNAGSSAQISQQKLQRWEIIIKEALQQSGSPVLTELHKPRSFDKMLEIVENGYMCLFFHQEIISSSTMAETLLTYKEEEKRLPLAVIIGPEGGFSEDEVDKMRKTGLKPVFLNTNILRAETAAIYALAAVQTLLSD